MNAYNLALSNRSLVKLQSLHNLKKIFIRTQLQNFNLTSCFFSDLNRHKDSELSISGVENISKLKFISKKKNKLSTVEEKDIETIENLKKGNIFHPYKGPGDRFKKTMLNDFKLFGSKLLHFCTSINLEISEPKYFNRYTDILIIGGGAVGLSIAYAIRKQFPYGPNVIVLDKDGSLFHESTSFCQSMTSCQLFNDESEILALKYGAEFFSSFSRHTEMEGKPLFKLPYDPLGSLILVNNENAEKVLTNNNKLKNFGIQTKLLNKSILKEKFPWLNCNNILFGSLGMCNEGTIDPWSYIVGLKSKCINLGVEFATAEVVDFGYNKNDISQAICKLPDGTYNSIEFAYCVIAGGIESLNLVNLFNKSGNFNFGLNLPLEERIRYEYCFYNPNVPKLNTPIVIDSNGTYFRREGLTGHYVIGVPSVVSNTDIDNKESEPYHVFQSKIKPFLLNKVHNFNKVDLVQGWCDAYDFCISNKVGITGPHPECERIVFALGFSYHGFQLLPALGRAVMEYLIYDDYQTIDFSPFHIENLWRKQHLEEDKRRRELLEAQQRIALSG